MTIIQWKYSIILVVITGIVLSCTRNDKSQKKMNIESLIEKLQEEAKKHPSILQSQTYPEIIEMGNTIIDPLTTSVDDVSTKHYLSLMAILEISPSNLQDIPEERRIEIWMQALQQGGHHNDWGIPGRYLAGGALDLERLGEKTIPHLLPLLEDTTPSAIWGSKEVMISQHYQNRMCDFAFFLIQHILKMDIEYSEKVQERDIAIQKLKIHIDKNLNTSFNNK